MPELIIFVISLAAIIKGADWLGEASVNVAKKLGMSQLLVGATLVSIATTLPETAISFFAGLEGESGISLGTILGSPAANLGLIMGIILLFGKTYPSKGYFTRTLNIFIILLTLVFIIGLGGSITPIAGWVLLFIAIVYLLLEFFVSKSEEGIVDQIETRFSDIKGFFNQSDGLKNVIYIFIGATLLAVSAKFLVDSATVIAFNLSIPTIVIAATVVALGTSIPELATAIHSSFKGRLALSVGNLAGASVLNLTMALGAGSIIHPIMAPKEALIISVLALAVISILNLASVLSKIAKEKIGAALIVTSIIFALVFISVEIQT